MDISDELAGLSLDDVFGTADSPNPNDPQPQATTQDVTPPAQQVTPAEPFLKASTGTVYKSAEDAVRGIEQKDALIQKLRQEAIERTGVDPVTGQPVQKAPQVVNYTQDSEKFLTDLRDAATKGDTKKYTDIQKQFVQDVIAPYAPMLTGYAKQQAVDAVSAKYSDFKQFAQSEDYVQTLNENPILKNSIAMAESSPERTADLTEFYTMAHRLNSARKLPEIVQQQHAVATQVRPTVSSGAPQAPMASTRVAAPPSLESKEGRAEIMRQFEAKYGDNVRI